MKPPYKQQMAQAVQLHTLVSNYHGNSGTLSKAEGTAAEKICPPQGCKRTHISAQERFLVTQLRGILHLSKSRSSKAPPSLLSPCAPHLLGGSGFWPEHTSQQLMRAQPGTARANWQGEALGLELDLNLREISPYVGSMFPDVRQHFLICISAARKQMESVNIMCVCLHTH